MKKFKSLVNVFAVLFIFVSGCNFKPVAEPLPFSVAANLNLLQENPQFVMYLNFKHMRSTDFWKKNISDSLLNAEKTFGSILNTFKQATSASISDGLDELYYSNSWFGENSVVLKGIFKKETLAGFLASDSLFSIAKTSGAQTIYVNNDNGVYFFFKDDFTICASNYLKQIDIMMQRSDTVKSGLLLNENLLTAIHNILYKEDLWMVSTEKMFIRGIFANFLESTSGVSFRKFEADTAEDTTFENDSANVDEKVTIENLYKRLNSISFCLKMNAELNLIIQCNGIDNESAKYFKNILNGVITVAKIKASDDQKTKSIKILDRINLERYDTWVYIDLKVDDSNLEELRKTNLIKND